MKASRIVIPKQFFILYAIVFSTYVIIPSTIFSQSFNQNGIQQYLRKGKHLERLFPDSAVYYYQKGLEFLDSKQLKDRSLSLRKIDLLIRIGVIFHQQSKYSFASDYYLKALNEARFISSDSLIAECNFNIAEVCLENGSYSKAVKLYYKAKGSYEKIKYKNGIFWSNIGLGIVYRELGNTKLSKKHYELARKIGEQENNKLYIAISYNNLGNLFKQIGEYETAIGYLQLALKSFEEYGKEKFVSDCLESIGELYAEIGNHERAIEYFKKSMEIAENSGDKYRLLSRYANIAKSYSNLKDNKNAVMYFSKTVELARAIGDKSRLSEILIMVSNFYRKNYSMGKALLNLKKSLLISEEIGDTVSFASGLNSISELYFLKKDYKSGYNYALRAYQISSKKDLMKTLAKSSLNLSKILELWGNYKDALYYFKIHKKTSGFLLNSKKLKIVEDAEAKYNIERIEKEKLKLENSALRGEEKLQRRNILITILVIILVLLTIGSVWFLRKKRIEKKESSENSLRMKRKIDLLDSQLNEKNRELTTKALLISQNNEVLKDIVRSIDGYLKNKNGDKNELRRLKNRLQEIYEEKSWGDFLQHFEQVHPQFYKKLLSRGGDLTSTEQKVCAFLRMNLNTKEISQLTSQSTKAIEVMRSRIRKKLRVSHEESLTKAIQSI